MKRAAAFALTFLLLCISGCKAIEIDTAGSDCKPVRVDVYGPDNVVLIENYAVNYSRAQTAIDALSAACDDNGIKMIVKGSGILSYVKSIGGYKTVGYGLGSGWVLFYNGKYFDAGAGLVKPKAGSRVSFYYSDNQGQNIMDKKSQKGKSVARAAIKKAAS